MIGRFDMDQMFNNSHILAWLSYFAESTELDLEHVKILDITKKNIDAASRIHHCALFGTR